MMTGICESFWLPAALERCPAEVQLQHAAAIQSEYIYPTASWVRARILPLKDWRGIATAAKAGSSFFAGLSLITARWLQ